MMRRMLLALLLAVTLHTSSSSEVDPTKQVLDILRDPTVYDKMLAPMNNESTSCVVFGTITDLKLDDLKRKMTVEMYFRMSWHDPRLQYMSSSFDRVVITDPGLAWKPDVFFPNAAKNKFHSTVYPESAMFVSKDGMVTVSYRVTSYFHCPMDFKHYPYDRQRCPINIETYGFQVDKLLFTDDDKRKFTSLVSPEGFHLEEITEQTKTTVVNTGTYSRREVTLEFTRNFSGYICQYFIPMIFLVIVGYLGELFVDPSEILTKVLITLVPMMTHFGYSAAVNMFVFPQTTYTKAVDIFSGISLIVLFLQFLRVTILHFCHKKLNNTSTKRTWMVKSVRCIGGTVLCVFYVLFLIIFFACY